MQTTVERIAEAKGRAHGERIAADIAVTGIPDKVSDPTVLAIVSVTAAILSVQATLDEIAAKLGVQ